MLRIKKNDIVMVTSGKDKGKTGKIIRVFAQERRVLIEGIGLVKKHVRRTREDQKGGVIQIERPISVSNVMPFCKNCSRGVRVGVTVNKDNTRSRICKRCKQNI